MKLADYVINFFASKGIDKMFVVYGAANAPLVDAFKRIKKTKYIATIHEQAGGFAAEGYAKTKKVPGIAIATSGPGGMNLVTPIGNCYYDSVPAIFITGQVNSKFMRKSREIRQVGFQETDIVDIVKPITKYSTIIKNPLEIKSKLELAWHYANEGRKGPVLIDIPFNIQGFNLQLNKLKSHKIIKNKTNFKIEDKIKKLIKDLNKFDRPCLLIGGGIKSANANKELLSLGRTLKIPMFPTWNALDVVSSDYKYYAGRIGTYGGAGRNFGIQNSNLLISIGSRISGRITGGNVPSFAREAKKYCIDIDKPALNKKHQQVKIDENIYCDAKFFISKLNNYLKKINYKTNKKKNEWLSKCMHWKNQYDPVLKKYYNTKSFVHPYVFIRKLSKKLKKNDILVADCGGNIVTCNHAFETKQGQLYFSNNGNSPMGFSFSGAIGSYLANPKGQVYCVIGDGGMNMNIQELQTIKIYNIKIKVIILNNKILGITKAFQKTNYQGKTEAVGPRGYSPPDYIKICKAYGIKTISLKNYNEIDDKINKFLKFDGPMILDVNCKNFYTYEPRIFGWDTPIEDMYPYLNRKEFKSNLFIKPMPNWKNPRKPKFK